MTHEHRTYKKRWLMLFGFSAANFSNALLWISFSPIATHTSAHYNVSNFYVNLLSLVYMVASIPLFFVASFVLDNYGLKQAVISGSALQLIGCWIRYLGSDSSSFYVLLGGQTICAIAQAFFLDSPAKLSSYWFAETQRTEATTIGSLSNVLGIAAGFIVAPGLVSSASDLPFLLLVEAIITSAASVLAIILFINDKPPTPPSESAFVHREDFFQGAKHAWKKPSYIFLAIAFGLALGIFNVLSTLIDQIVRPFGYGDDDISLFGGLLIGAGIVGAGVAGAIVDKTREYKKAILVCLMGVVGSCVWFVLVLKPNQGTLLACAFSSIGIFGMGILPISLECASELVFPVGEGVASGSLMLAGQILGASFLFGAQALQDSDGSYVKVCWGMVGITIVSLILATFIKPVYLRLQAEKDDSYEVTTPGSHRSAEAARGSSNMSTPVLYQSSYSPLADNGADAAVVVVTAPTKEDEIKEALTKKKVLRRSINVEISESE